ncbi:hypothetical protein NDU88_006426 [Pleurodeles waltl]|uniref:Uncharacterized protein n=1 Tax=Pleurodeles waltl TaxID=8319 RepID=A0AAV7TE87_PLEWA|nr:hypothetical protein NDU88_006426 [Pleurodeles waltl]
MEGCFPLGWRAAFWRSPASPAGNPEYPRRSFDRAAVFWRSQPGRRLPPLAGVRVTPFVSMGNGYVDQVARFCALNCISFKDQWELLPETENETCTGYALRVVDTLEELKLLQGHASRDEKRSWVKMQCVQRPDDLWVSEEG